MVCLPERYTQSWREPFDARVVPSLTPGVCILDVGSGRRPTIPPEQRPARCHYVGLALSRKELTKAPAGSYDEVWESDVARRVPKLKGRFDLVVSWQVLEHVKPLDVAMENLRAYLRPGGRLVALLSGTFSAFGLINQVVPQRLGVWAMGKFLRRDPATVFPAYYHCCWHSALTRILDSWREAEVVARYRGAGYFGFSPFLQQMYLRYEEWAWHGGHRNLATHYLVTAKK
jgi:SAM-dependent methyltransferase